MWKSKSETVNGNLCFYTAYYCPQCKKQRIWHTIDYNVWKCDYCGLKMIEKSDGKLHLT